MAVPSLAFDLGRIRKWPYLDDHGCDIIEQFLSLGEISDRLTESLDDFTRLEMAVGADDFDRPFLTEEHSIGRPGFEKAIGYQEDEIAGLKPDGTENREFGFGKDG